uniref:uncharacterized protein LOC105352047 n=1 Tax=Fragaria vesca subsp. vesca TaxID=101020 RepID=UPI0005CB1CD4|nr:PREDICTED: uncharacterized protein LOC105352047 [Fragaria vesca subsp. vesca]
MIIVTTPEPLISSSLPKVYTRTSMLTLVVTERFGEHVTRLQRKLAGISPASYVHISMIIKIMCSKRGEWPKIMGLLFTGDGFLRSTKRNWVPKEQRDRVSRGGQGPEGNLWTDLVTIIRVLDPKRLWSSTVLVKLMFGFDVWGYSELLVFK